MSFGMPKSRVLNGNFDLALDQLLAKSPVTDQLFDRDDGNVVLGGQFLQLGEAGHAEVALAADFDQHAHGPESGHPHQIDRRFGMPGTSQHTAVLGQEGRHVTGLHKIVGSRVGLGQGTDGFARLDGLTPVPLSR